MDRQLAAAIMAGDIPISEVFPRELKIKNTIPEKFSLLGLAAGLGISMPFPRIQKPYKPTVGDPLLDSANAKIERARAAIEQEKIQKSKEKKDKKRD